MNGSFDEDDVHCGIVVDGNLSSQKTRGRKHLSCFVASVCSGVDATTRDVFLHCHRLDPLLFVHDAISYRNLDPKQ